MPNNRTQPVACRITAANKLTSSLLGFCTSGYRSICGRTCLDWIEFDSLVLVPEQFVRSDWLDMIAQLRFGNAVAAV